MSGRKFGYFSMLRAMSWRQVCLCALFCLMLLTLIGLNLYELMRLGTESAYHNCENSYLLASRELGEYLRVADKAIDSASRRIEEMRDGGATPEELPAYMTRETGNLDSLIAGPTTGVYGYIDGVYLDGTGWTPQEGYDPTQRPWYLGATRAYGNVTHIPPFDNMQTGSTTITVCKMLAAGRGGLFLLMDVDKFKSVNDTFGHEVGDKVLIAIANAMRASFRKQDVIMRLGGDEFAVYVPGVYDEATAEPIIKRLFDRIYEDSPPELGERKISVSVGATFYRDNDRFSFSDLYKKADAGTYESKAFATSHVTFCR